MTTFTIAPYALDEIGAEGYGRISAKVVGYWSSDSITLYIKRGGGLFDSGAQGEWSAEISNSSGGRDSKEVKSDLEASRNYAAAMVALADLGEQILARADGLERAYQCRREQQRAEREAAKAAKQAAEAADAPVGEPRARIAVTAAMASARNGVRGLAFGAIERGTDTIRSRIEFKLSRGGVVRVTINGCASSRSEAIARLAAASARSLA